MQQEIQYCTTPDGVRLAYSEYDLQGPIFRHQILGLVLRYDGRGIGLSQRDISEISFDRLVADEGRQGRGRGRKMTHDPMQLSHVPEQLRHGARCGARTRSGMPCRSPAVIGRRRCRMHGGARGSGGPKGSRNGNYKHGRYTAEAVASRRWIRQLASPRREGADQETASALRA
jgi:hypothetical protein